MRTLVVLCVLFLASVPRAQDRRMNADRGGPVALCSTDFEWTEAECRDLLGARTGTRLLVQFEAGQPTDPLAKSTLPAVRTVVTPRTDYAGDDVEFVRSCADAAAIELLGGAWIDWWSVLDPYKKRSRLGIALQEAHRRGVPILGVGAGAGFLARASMVERAELQRPERNPHRPDFDAGIDGLGLCDVVWDASAMQHASLDRVLRTLLRANYDHAVYLLGDAAWIVDAGDDVTRGARAGSRVLTRGDGCVFVVDAARARRMRESLREARLSCLVQGDEWDPNLRRPRGADWTVVGSLAPGTSPSESEDVADALDASTLRARWMPAVAEALDIHLRSPRADLRAWSDERSLRSTGSRPRFASVAFDAQWEFPEPVRRNRAAIPTEAPR